MPKFGDRKTIDGVTGVWDGSTWRREPEGGNVNPTAAGFGNSDVDRLLAEARGTIDRSQHFADPIEAAGRIAATPVEDPRTAAVNTFFNRFGRGMRGIVSTSHPESALNAALSTVTTPLHGYGELAKLGKAIYNDPGMLNDPTLPIRAGIENIKGLGTQVENLANAEPEEGGRAVRDALIATAAPGIVGRAITQGPALAREAASTVGKGMEAVGNATRLRGAGLPTVTALTGHPVAAVAEMTIPPALRGIGRVLQKFGPESATPGASGLEALRTTEMPAADFFAQANAAGLSPAETMAELAKRGAAKAAGQMSAASGPSLISEAELPAAVARQQLATEIPYRMGQPTAVEGLNSGILRDEPGIGVTLNDASKMSKSGLQQLNDFMGSGPNPDALAGIRNAIAKDTTGGFTHEEFLKQLHDSLDQAKTTADVTNPEELDLTPAVTELSPLDAASRLAKLTRIQRAAGAAYGE